MTKKKEKAKIKCGKCGCTDDECDLEEMPCCGGYLCWEQCLYELPKICPLCGARIRVESKDPITKESYVELIALKEEQGYNFNVTIKSKLPISKHNIENALRELTGNGEILIKERRNGRNNGKRKR